MIIAGARARYSLPSRKYLVKKILPIVHNEIMSWVKFEIEGVVSQLMCGVKVPAVALC